MAPTRSRGGATLPPRGASWAYADRAPCVRRGRPAHTGSRSVDRRASQHSPTQLARRLTHTLDSLARERRFSGVVLLAKDGRPVLHRAYGLADRERRRPNTPETAFNLGSINKLFTRIAIRQLGGAGRLDLDAPLGRYWPDYPTAEVARQVTVRQPLEHRSGLGGNIFGTPAGGTRASLRHNRDFLRLFASEPLQFPPGSAERTGHFAKDSLPPNTARGYTRGDSAAPPATPLAPNTEELPGRARPAAATRRLETSSACSRRFAAAGSRVRRRQDAGGWRVAAAASMR